MSALLRVALVSVAAALLAAEFVRPLRRRTHEPKLRRMQRNAVVAGFSAAAVHLCEQPLVMPLARLVTQRRWGVLQRVSLPAPLKTAVALAALDYTLYLWHVIVHRVPWLWRFHRVHHADLDMDASTAIRFHFGEMIASVPWRAAQVVVIGVDARTLQTWQTLTLMSILFHHSNVRLPNEMERVLGLVLVTPRLHGIHHSRRANEMNSNWSSGLSVWDRLHRTFRDDVPEGAIEIGVESFDAPQDVSLRRLLVAPLHD